MSKNKLTQILTLCVGIIISLNFTWHVYLYRGDIFTKFDSNYWTKRYQESQWVVAQSKNSIGDDGLYMYAGYRYVQGDDPTLLNAEIPPLGKYIIGIFETTTGYTGAFSLFCGALVLVAFYLLNTTIFTSSLLAILPVLFFSFEPLFTAQIRAAYLDTLYLSCLLLGFFFFFRKKYILAGITFGAFMAVKSPFLVGIVYCVVFSYMLLQKKWSFRSMCSMVIPTGIVFLLSYFMTFLHGHTIIYFLQVQKYIIHFYSSGAKAVVGAIFPMLTSGNWYTWFGPVQKVAEWTILWPIVSIGAIVSVGIFFKKKNAAVLFQLLWVGFYLAFLVFTPLFARYLLLVLPFLYNLSIWSLSVATKSKYSWLSA